MKTLHKSFSANSKSVSTTIEMEGLKHNLFYVSTSKGRTSVSKLDGFSIDKNFVKHQFGDIMANMNAIKAIPNAITRATEKALWTEHDKQMEGIKTALIEKFGN